MTRTDDHQRAKRQLRAEIARLRRRIDGRIRSVGREGRRLTSWQTYVRRYPAHAVAAAMGMGLAVSSGLRGGWRRYVGARVVSRVVTRLVDRALGELERVCRGAATGHASEEAEGADDVRS
ncbi:MAG: hypothetical protein ACYTG0_29785 [Planctomycetota bacterium]